MQAALFPLIFAFLLGEDSSKAMNQASKAVLKHQGTWCLEWKARHPTFRHTPGPMQPTPPYGSVCNGAAHNYVDAKYIRTTITSRHMQPTARRRRRSRRTYILKPQDARLRHRSLNITERQKNGHATKASTAARRLLVPHPVLDALRVRKVIPQGYFLPEASTQHP